MPSSQILPFAPSPSLALLVAEPLRAILNAEQAQLVFSRTVVYGLNNVVKDKGEVERAQRSWQTAIP